MPAARPGLDGILIEPANSAGGGGDVAERGKLTGKRPPEDALTEKEHKITCIRV